MLRETVDSPTLLHFQQYVIFISQYRLYKQPFSTLLIRIQYIYSKILVFDTTSRISLLFTYFETRVHEIRSTCFISKLYVNSVPFESFDVNRISGLKNAQYNTLKQATIRTAILNLAKVSSLLNPFCSNTQCSP